MSKELKALETIGNTFTYWDNIQVKYFHRDCYKLVEKSLKALEIIKSKEMLSLFKDISGKCFIVFNTTAIEIPQEEYELLKEAGFVYGK